MVVGAHGCKKAGHPFMMSHPVDEFVNPGVLENKPKAGSEEP